MNNTDTYKNVGAKMNNSPGKKDYDSSQFTSSGDNDNKTIKMSSLRDLKAVFLSMDWEINDDILNKLIGESEKLMKSAEGDLVLVAFFKMLSSIGKYIKKNKAAADKDAVGLLGSVFDSMERVIGTEMLTNKERKQLVVDQIAKFQLLKQKVTGAQISPTIRKRMNKNAVEAAIEKLKVELAAIRDEVTDLKKRLTKLLAQ